MWDQVAPRQKAWTQYSLSHYFTLISLAHWAFTALNPIVILLLLILSPARTAVKMYSFLNIYWLVMRSNMSLVKAPCCRCSLEEMRSFEPSIRCYWLKRRLQSPANTLEWLLKRLSSIRNDFLWKNRASPPRIAHWSTTASWKRQIGVVEDWFWANKHTFFPTTLAALLVTGKWRLVCRRHGESTSPLFACDPRKWLTCEESYEPSPGDVRRTH